MRKTINNIITGLERVVAFIMNLVWIPSFISPPNNTAVDFITDDWYILAGTYEQGIYKIYPAKYKKVKAWRFRGHVSFPKLHVAGLNYNVTMFFSAKDHQVWDYKDLRGEKHHVSYNTRKLLEKNPLNTTVKDKRDKIQKQSMKAKEQRHAKVKAIKGNSL